MAENPVIKINRQIDSVKLIDSGIAVLEYSEKMPLSDTSEMQQTLETQKLHYDNLIQALEAAAEKMQIIYTKMIVEHRQAIAKLAVEIARKILVQKVKDGDYQIESIVQEALNSAPSRQNIVIRLNPQDYAKFQKIQQSDGTFASVKFVADAAIGQAECILETPRGKIESLIDAHLEQVSRALNKAM